MVACVDVPFYNLIITENKGGENRKDDRGMKEWRGIVLKKMERHAVHASPFFKNTAQMLLFSFFGCRFLLCGRLFGCCFFLGCCHGVTPLRVWWLVGTFATCGNEIFFK